MKRVSVLIDPAIKSGAPHIDGTLITSEIIATYVWDGWSIEQMIQIWPGLTVQAIFNACWYEAHFGSLLMQKRWKKWARASFSNLTDEYIEELELPPNRYNNLPSIAEIIIDYVYRLRKIL